MASKLLTYFRHGRWLRMATHYVRHPAKMAALLRNVRRYMSKEGLREVGGVLLLLWNYVSDVARGRYRQYNVRSLLLAVAAFVYLVSPVDFIPDLLPGGLVDDVGVLFYVVNTLREELGRYNRSRCGDDDENVHDGDASDSRGA